MISTNQKDVASISYINILPYYIMRRQTYYRENITNT